MSIEALIGLLMGFGSLLGGLITVYVNMRINAAKQEVRRDELEKRINRLDDDVKHSIDKLESKIDSIEHKIDNIHQKLMK